MSIPQKALRLYDGVVAMYRDVGATVLEVEPLKNQSFDGFKKFAMSCTRPPLDGKAPVVAVTKAAWFVKKMSRAINTRCGIVVFTCEGVTGVGYTDVEMSIASMRTHFHKYILKSGDNDDLDPDTCIVCQTAPKAVQCSICYSSLCQRCFVKINLRRRSDFDAHVCPGCRATGPVVDILERLNYEAFDFGDSYNEAILDAMVTLNKTDTCLTITSGHQYRTMNVTCSAKFANLQKHTKHGKAVKKLLKTPGTVFLVGEPPSMCMDCDLLHEGDLEGGRAFCVEEDGVVEVIDHFGPMMVCVQAVQATPSR